MSSFTILALLKVPVSHVPRYVYCHFSLSIILIKRVH